METKKISELERLKIQNCNLNLQILQMRAELIVTERNRILAGEIKRLKCSHGEWNLDERTGELIKSEVKKDGIE